LTTPVPVVVNPSKTFVSVQKFDNNVSVTPFQNHVYAPAFTNVVVAEPFRNLVQAQEFDNTVSAAPFLNHVYTRLFSNSVCAEPFLNFVHAVRVDGVIVGLFIGTSHFLDTDWNFITDTDGNHILLPFSIDYLVPRAGAVAPFWLNVKGHRYDKSE
jgi:hypothetical protein